LPFTPGNTTPSIFTQASLNPGGNITTSNRPDFDNYNITMANQRAVINLLVKNENYMRRNTANTRWVSDRPKAGPSKNVQYVTQRSQHVSHKASVSDELYNVSPRSHTHVWPQDRTKPLPPSPLESYNYAARRDSPVSATSPIDFAGLEQTRKQSVATVCPFYPASVKKPEPKSRESWWKAAIDTESSKQGAVAPKKKQSKTSTNSAPIPWYRLAKDIYKVGPKGDGQKAWKAYQEMRKEKRNAKTTQAPPVPTKQKKYEKPLPPPPPSNPDGVLHPPLRPRLAQSRKGKQPESPYPRKDSGFSSTSYEVPIAIDKNIRRTVDANKPLPRVPRLDPAPKARKTYQPSRAPPLPPKTDSQRPVQQAEGNRTEKDTHLNPWWKVDKQSAKPGLKSKISHPGPLMASNKGVTINIATDCGGVGGPAAAVSMPVNRLGAPLLKEERRPSPLSSNPSHERLSEKRKGKQKMIERDDTPPTHWRDKFEFVGPTFEAGNPFKQKKRRSSDASFG
jgi:hypothetical protein